MLAPQGRDDSVPAAFGSPRSMAERMRVTSLIARDAFARASARARAPSLGWLPTSAYEGGRGSASRLAAPHPRS